MTYRKCLTVTFAIILGFLVVNTHARSWDLAIVIGREVQFFARNRTITGHVKLADAVALCGVAYDDITRTMYFSDPNNKNMSIFSNDLTDKNVTSKPLLKRQSKSHILGLAFETKTRDLFWSDALRGVIMRMHVPLVGPPEAPTILHNLTYRTPQGIALDVCNSHIYWVNSNSTNPSIDRSNLDGSDRTSVIKENLYMPIAVAVDHANEKLYWIDDVEGLRIKIERSNLDGSERELLVHPKHHHPVYLAVDSESIYWSDLVYKAVWMIPKDTKAGETPEMFQLYHSRNHDADPAGIVARDNVGKVDCPAIAKIRQKTSLINQTFSHVVEAYNNLTTSTEESEQTTEAVKYCLNGGLADDNESDCQCKLGFTGTRCETDLCHNYCFRGNCSINSEGQPTCECSESFVGSRCEMDLCKDYCLHDGQCFIQDGKPACKCQYSEGYRCETLNNITVLCDVFCANPEAVPTNVVPINCRCFNENERTAQMVSFEQNDEYRTLLPILAVFLTVLVLVIVVLSYYVNKFRKRPRIKKRFVVSKGGVTPLTSRPQLPDSQCEITIENCCNMNICETPCFEPKLRNAAPATNGTKREEKNSLLDNMEQNSW